MAYEIIKSNGTTLAVVKDGLIDQTSSSLVFVGKTVVNYGQIQNTNFLHLLEHFANATEPPNKQDGQIWLDTETNTLKLYHQNYWQTISTLAYSPSNARANNRGNLWYDSDNQQLFINNGGGFNLIGPDKAPGFRGTTRWESAVLIDTTDVPHAVIKCTLNGEVIAIMTKDSFEIKPSDIIPGFRILGRGMNFKNGNTTDVQLYGISQFAFNADALKSQDGNEYITPSVASTANSIMQRDDSGNTNILKLTASELASNDGLLSGPWRINADLTPAGNATINLGAADITWNNVYVKQVRAADISVTNQVTASVVKFSTLRDPQNTDIIKFDKDVALAANSDGNLSTQKAVKTYVDAQVKAEKDARVGAIDGVTNTINGLIFVPAGCVFYTASPNVPTGYLRAEGQQLSKTQDNYRYAALFNAIGTYYGGDGNPYFNLPDLRGEFIRGVSSNRSGVDNRALASFQAQSAGDHRHYIFREVANNAYRAGEYYISSYPNNAPVSRVTRKDNDESYIISAAAKPGDEGDANVGRTSSAGSGETRPRNVALYAIIKY
jgi:microcystin-dependent protein